MCLITHQKFVRQVWIFSRYTHKLTTKLQAQVSVPITSSMHYLQFVWVKTQVTKQDAPYTPIRYA